MNFVAICQLPIEKENGNWQLAANLKDIRNWLHNNKKIPLIEMIPTRASLIPFTLSDCPVTETFSVGLYIIRLSHAKRFISWLML